MKYLISFALLTFSILVGGQDLIQNTLTQTTYTRSNKAPNRIFQLIEKYKEKRSAFIPKQVFEYEPQQRAAAYSDYVATSISLKLNQNRLKDLKLGEKNIVLTIPVSEDRSFELELTRVTITGENFQVKTASESSSNRAYTALFYRGIVKDDPQSFATISIFDDHVRGLIADEGGNYVLANVGDRKSSYLLYNDRHLNIEHNWECATSDGEIVQQSQLPPPDTRSVVDNRCVDIYLECEFALYNTQGGLDPTIEYVLGLFHEVATLYFNEELNLQISEIFIWDVDDPYSGNNSTCALRPIFEANTPDFPGYVAHLLTSRTSEGCAYGARYCDEKTYGVTGGLISVADFPTYSFEVYLLSHEIGHQVGSPHTHACEWNGNNTQIDDCGNEEGNEPNGIEDGCYNPETDTPILPAGGGTVMSYCVLNTGIGVDLNLGFGDQPGDLIRATVDAATCLEGECACADETDWVLNEIPYEPGVYEAINTITASGVVDQPDHSPVIFRAGQRITLSNFVAAANSTFIAQIGGDICEYELLPLVEGVDNRSQEIEETTNLLEFTQNEESTFTVYPNPFRQNVTLALNLEQTEEVSIGIFDGSGRLVANGLSQQTLEAGRHQLQYEMQELPAGIYHLRLQLTDRVEVRRLVKVE